ncbi:MAG: hypothetical protein ACE14M_13805, partial [Terriglobales bacterium]
LEQVPGMKRVTAGGDKGYDTRDFVAECRRPSGATSAHATPPRAAVPHGKIRPFDHDTILSW